jgi:hypothetical protein
MYCWNKNEKVHCNLLCEIVFVPAASVAAFDQSDGNDCPWSLLFRVHSLLVSGVLNLPRTMEVAGEEPSLQEALQFVDDWDIDIAALFGLDDALSPAVPPPVRPPSKVRRATVERTELREELQQLQQHLESSSHVTPHAVGTLANEWREIAARQREQRLAAEVDNRKLHEVVESQLKFAHKTATFLKKVQHIDTALGSERTPSIDKYRGPHVAILDSQLTRLNGLAVEARAIFSSGRFAAPMRQEVRDVAFHNLGQEGLLIELAVSWVLPFTVDRVVDVLWVHTTRMPRTERTICLKVQSLYPSITYSSGYPLTTSLYPSRIFTPRRTRSYPSLCPRPRRLARFSRILSTRRLARPTGRSRRGAGR